MNAIDSLKQVLSGYECLAVAVSGGIDSTLSAHVARDVLGDGMRAVNAVSPAVRATATARVGRHARQGEWHLDLVEAGKFDDPHYRENPVNRCYFCKRNLYGTIASLTKGAIASGTNCDDLGDFRPGLIAAKEREVVHPYVESGLGKRDIYALAHHLGLGDLAALPAQPCLSSRVESGLAIDADDLAFVEQVERALHEVLGRDAVLRCRITHHGVVLELGPALEGESKALSATALVAEQCRRDGRTFLGQRAYRRGAAFLHKGVA